MMYHRFTKTDLLLRPTPESPETSIPVHEFESLQDLCISQDMSTLYACGVTKKDREAKPKVEKTGDPQYQRWKIGSFHGVREVDPNHLNAKLYRCRLREGTWQCQYGKSATDPVPIPGKEWVAIWDGGGILLLDENGKKVNRFRLGSTYTWFMSASSDGRFLVSYKRAGDDHKFLVMDLHTMTAQKMKPSAVVYAWLNEHQLLFRNQGAVKCLDLVTGSMTTHMTHIKKYVPKNMKWPNPDVGEFIRSSSPGEIDFRSFVIVDGSLYLNFRGWSKAFSKGCHAILRMKPDGSDFKVLHDVSCDKFVQYWHMAVDKRQNVQIYDQVSFRQSKVFGPDKAFYLEGWRPIRTSQDTASFKLRYPQKHDYDFKD